jgi:hypothetical protein
MAASVPLFLARDCFYMYVEGDLLSALPGGLTESKGGGMEGREDERGREEA